MILNVYSSGAKWNEASPDREGEASQRDQNHQENIAHDHNHKVKIVPCSKSPAKHHTRIIIASVKYRISGYSSFYTYVTSKHSGRPPLKIRDRVAKLFG